VDMTPQNPEKLALLPREAARELGISERSLWSQTAPRGPIPCVRIGRSVRYSVEVLKRFAAGELATAG
jgi:hypothetical protein